MSPKKIIIVIALLSIAAFLGYSLYVTFRSGANEAGVVSCPTPDSCIWTAHIHAYLPISLCGEDYRLPVEVGALDTKSHTHEEKNIAHWHIQDGLPYDPVTKQITDTESLTLGAFFDAIAIPFDENRINGKKNGDLCPNGTAGTVKVFVNSTSTPLLNPRAYVWKNRDVIRIFFDSRTPEEAGQEVINTPITFPSLGRG